MCVDLNSLENFEYLVLRDFALSIGILRKRSLKLLYFYPFNDSLTNQFWSTPDIYDNFVKCKIVEFRNVKEFRRDWHLTLHVMTV